MDIREYLQTKSGSEPEIGLASGNQDLSLETMWGKLPVSPKKLRLIKEEYVPRQGFEPSQFRDVINEEDIAEHLNDLTEAGGVVYPLPTKVDVPQIGKNLVLGSEDLVVPYLPFFSVRGVVSGVEHRDGYAELEISLKNNEKVKVALSDEQETEKTSLTVRRTNFPDKYPEFEIESWTAKNLQTRRYLPDKKLGLKAKFVDREDTEAIIGKKVIAGPDPRMDYTFCDMDLENGLTRYSYPSAWYTPSGTPTVDAIFIEEK